MSCMSREWKVHQFLDGNKNKEYLGQFSCMEKFLGERVHDLPVIFLIEGHRCPVTSSSMAFNFRWHKLLSSLPLFGLFTAWMKLLLHFCKFTSTEVTNMLGIYWISLELWLKFLILFHQSCTGWAVDQHPNMLYPLHIHFFEALIFLKVIKRQILSNFIDICFKLIATQSLNGNSISKRERRTFSEILA